MPLVTMPDGTVVDMPEKLSAEQAASLSALQARQSKGVDLLDEGVRVADKAIRGGAYALPNLVRHGGNWLEEKMPTPEWSKINIPKGVVDAYDKISTPRQPQTGVGKALGNIGEAAVGSLISPAGLASPGKAAIVGGMSGAGSEGAAKLLGDNALVRILGGLAGGGVGSVLTSPATNRGEIANMALKDVNEMDLRAAQAKMQEMAAKGTPINLSQAMGRDSNIDKLVGVLANSKEGTRTIDQLRRQPAQVEGQADAFLSNLPGNVLPRTNMANQAQDAATKVIQGANKQATDAWTKLAPGAVKIPETAVQSLDKSLQDLAKKYPNTSQEALINEVRKNLKIGPAPVAQGGIPAPQILGANGQPISQSMGPNGLPMTERYLTDAKQVKGAVDDALENFGPRYLNTPSLQGKDLYVAQEVRDKMKAFYGDNAPDLLKANQAFTDVKSNVVAPLKEGVVGKIAQPAGAMEGKAAAEGKLFQVFNSGSDPRAKVSDISTLAKELNKSGQGEVFVNGAKSWMSEKIAKATQEAGGRGNDDIAKVLHNSFFATDLQKQGFRDMMAGVADAQKVPRQDLVRGAETFFDYIGRAARRPTTAEGVSGDALRRAAEGSLFGKVGQISIITPLRQPVLKWVDFLRSDAYSAMDKLVTSPEGVDMLIKLGKDPKMGPGAVKAMSTFLGTAASADNSPEINNP